MQNINDSDINVVIRTPTSERKNTNITQENFHIRNTRQPLMIDYFIAERNNPIYNYFNNLNSERINIRNESAFDIFGVFDNSESFFEDILNSRFQQDSKELKKDDTIKLMINKKNKQTETKEDCVICGNNMEKNEEVTKLNNCSHSFHYNCISEWGKYKQSCPICRCKIPKY